MVFLRDLSRYQLALISYATGMVWQQTENDVVDGKLVAAFLVVSIGLAFIGFLTYVFHQHNADHHSRHRELNRRLGIKE